MESENQSSPSQSQITGIITSSRTIDVRRKKRVELYEELQRKRGRPLIVYVTSSRTPLEATMNPEVERPFIDIIESIPASDSEIDVLLYSLGGDPNTAWKLMSLLRERFSQKVCVLVPYMAYSAATMFALGANEIVMHPYANLGPIDPQITIRSKEGTTRFAYEDLCGFFRFLKKEANVNGEEQVTRLIEKMFLKLDPQNLGFAYRSSEMAGSIAERMLNMHLGDNNKSKQISTNLNRSFYNHNDSVSRGHAKSLGLNIIYPEKDIESLIWQIYTELEDALEMLTAFNLQSELFKDKEVEKALAPQNPIELPRDIQNQKEVMEYINKQMAQITGTKNYVDYQVIFELLETTKQTKANVEEGKIYGIRNSNTEITTVPRLLFKGWKNFGN